MSPATFWIVALFVYGAIASLLPVWVLLQPRDYINGVQLFIGLILLFGSVLTATLFSAVKPEIVAPAINTNLPEGTPSMIDRKSTRLNSSHVSISYAVFCLKKKTL